VQSVQRVANAIAADVYAEQLDARAPSIEQQAEFDSAVFASMRSTEVVQGSIESARSLQTTTCI
jgi:hypothetical protein